MVMSKKIAILGFGREGKSLFKFLKKSPEFRTAEIEILDQKLDKNYLKNLSRFEIIFRSPGIPYTSPQLYRARCDGTKISSATILFFKEINDYKLKTGNYKPALIGVTGTKGKGTTSTLIYKILKNAGFKTVLAGNIGKPMLDILPQAKKADFVVLELSSFQLQDLPYSPQIAVVLDVFPDHLDQHKSLREYYGSKANVGRFQKKSDAVFYFADNKLSTRIAAKSPAKKFGVRPPEDNLSKNSFMAAAVSRYLGAPEKTIQKTIKNFPGLEHRLELIRTMKHSNILQSVRISFYNDSAATNPEATAMAIKTLSHVTSPMSLVLIAGGKNKGLDYRPLTQAIKKSDLVKMVILFGENKEKMRKVLVTNDMRQVTKTVKDLKTAVKLAYKTAQSIITNYQLPVTILFSPASASFDMFKNYQDRGDQFKKAVRALK